MIIGINGKLQSGKDTTFNIIKELRPEAEKISFARKLKDSAKAALGIDEKILEYLKNRENLKFVLYNVDENIRQLYVEPFNMRQYLQRRGTEAGREIFGEDFWVDQALPDNIEHEEKLLVITDMRFPNEVERVIELGGFTVRIDRPNIETEHANHPSEQEIPEEKFDWILENNGTIEELKEKVKKMLAEFEKC